MTRWRITIEYDGRPYKGWQRQDNVPSIQQAIEEAIKAFSSQNITIHAAGRTDAGVHAMAQVAHFDLDDTRRSYDAHTVISAINAHLHNRTPAHTISIINASQTDENFHARFSATGKLYRYRIANRAAPLALDHGRAWHIRKPLDESAIQDAACHLIGHHDFTTFRDSECQSKGPFKTLRRLDVMRRGDEILIEAEALSFLHHQVRNMVGTLAMVGEGKWSADDVKTALDARDRTRGGPTAPPDGLCLVEVRY